MASRTIVVHMCEATRLATIAREWAAFQIFRAAVDPVVVIPQLPHDRAHHPITLGPRRWRTLACWRAWLRRAAARLETTTLAAT